MSIAYDAAEEIIEPSRQLEIPGNDGWPLFGHTLNVLMDLRGLFQRMYDRYGPVFRINLLFKRSAVFLGPQAVQTVLVDRAKNFSSGKAYDGVFGGLFSQCVIMRDFDDHSKVRQLLHPAFREPALREYLDRMHPVITKAINQWPEGKTFQFFPAGKELALNLAASVFFGLDFGPDLKKINSALQTLITAPMAIIRKPIPGLAYARGIKAREFLRDYLRTVIPQRRMHPASDMLSQLCQARGEDGAQLGDDEIIEQMIFMIIAAHDSTASAITSMAYLLAKHPDWQERLRMESLKLSTDYPSYDNLRELKSASLVLKETLRLHTPAVMIPRQALRDCEVEGVEIPAGTNVWVCPDFTHHMSEWWSNPAVFDPERFSEERAEHKRHRFSYMPFGGGAHACIGFHFAEMELKAVLHQLLLKFRLHLPEGYEAKYQMLPMPRPKDKLPIRLEPISATPARSRERAQILPRPLQSLVTAAASSCPMSISEGAAQVRVQSTPAVAMAGGGVCPYGHK